MAKLDVGLDKATYLRGRVHVPYVVPLLKRMPSIEWNMTKLVVLENGHQKNTCYNKITLCVESVDTILDSIINTIAKAYAIT